MCGIIGWKSYVMHSARKLYDEDMNLNLDTVVHSIGTLEDSENDGSILFLINQLSMLRGL